MPQTQIVVTPETPPDQKTSIAELHELGRIKKRILESHATTESLVASAKDRARQALAEAILCGGMLKRAKQIIGHGGFGRWCQRELKGISERTIRNYMTLYNSFGGNRQTVADLAPTSLKHAYIMLGIVKEKADDERSAEKPEPKATLGYTTSTTGAVPAAAGKVLNRSQKPNRETVLAHFKRITSQYLIDLNNIINLGILTRDDFDDTLLRPVSEALERALGKE